MASLQAQIASLFEGTEPEVRELVIRVLEIEKELLHLELPRGVMEKINDALDVIAQESIKRETRP